MAPGWWFPRNINVRIRRWVWEAPVSPYTVPKGWGLRAGSTRACFKQSRGKGCKGSGYRLVLGEPVQC